MEPNVILIVLDTLRNDVLGLYGGDAKTPALNGLARDAMVYDEAIAPSPWTYPSHVSLFTGLYLNEHGVHETVDAKLVRLNEFQERLRARRLAEHLKDLGYHTMGISNNIMISRFTHFDRGFEQFFNLEPSPWSKYKEVDKARSLGTGPFQVLAELVKKRGIADILHYGNVYFKIRYMEKALNYPVNKGADLTNSILFNSKLSQGFFLFVNLIETHEPYIGYSETEAMNNFTGLKMIREGRVQYLKRQYINEVEYLDKRIGEFLEMLKDRGLYDNSIIIITSDHGQAFNEHGFLYHGVYLYDEIVRVPLIVKYPYGRKFPKRKGYQSLTSIFAMIDDVVRGGDDRHLTTASAISESYSNTNTLPKRYSHRRDYVRKRHDKRRIAIYKNGFKVTVNGTDGLVEEFLKDGGVADPERKENRRMLSLLLSDIRKIKKNEEFGVPSGLFHSH